MIARIAGTVEQPEVSADLELGPAQLAFGGVPAANSVLLRARLADDRFDIISGSAEWQQSRLALAGGAPLQFFAHYLPAALVRRPPAAGPAVLRLTAASMTPRVLAPFVDAETLGQIDGLVDATVRLEASALAWDRLQGEVRLDRFEARVAALPIAQQVPTRVVVENGIARVAAWDWTGQGAALTVSGEVGLAGRQANLRADGRLDFRVLTPFVRDAGLVTAGTLTAGLSISGPLDDPRVGGTMALSGGEARLDRPRIVVTDLASAGVLEPRRIQFRELTGSINGGRLAGSVDVEYPSDAPVAVRVTAGATGMALELPDGLRSELDADLTVSLAGGPAGPAGSVSGLVTIVRSAYRQPLSVMNTLLAAVRARRLAPPAPEPSLLDRLVLDVRVVTDSDVIVENNLVRLDLGADLRVIGTAAAPGVSGRAELRPGGELFLGRNRYTIDSGTIAFDNPATIEPDLEIEARTRAGGEDIELTLSGTPDALDVDLRSSSQPALGEADLASMLLTGRPLAQVAGAEGQIIAEQAIGYLSGDILGAVSRVVGLDTIRLGGVEASTGRGDAAAIAAQADPTSRLTFSKRIGSLFDVTLSQSLREGDAQTWILDYQPLRQVNLRFVSDDDTLRTYEFRHDVSFGNAAVARPRPAARVPTDVRVTAVSLSGSLPIAESRLRDALDLEPGDRFEVSEWQRDRDRVTQLLQQAGYLEARVTADRSENADGVALSYAVLAGPRTVVNVTGFTLPRERLAAIEQAWSQFVVGDFLEEEALAIVQRALAAGGHLEPRITVDLSEASADEGGAMIRTLTVAIEPGTRTLNRRLAVESGDAALDAELLEWLRGQGLEEASWRDPESLQRALEAYLAVPRTAEGPRDHRPAAPRRAGCRGHGRRGRGPGRDHSRHRVSWLERSAPRGAGRCRRPRGRRTVRPAAGRSGASARRSGAAKRRFCQDAGGVAAGTGGRNAGARRGVDRGGRTAAGTSRRRHRRQPGHRRRRGAARPSPRGRAADWDRRLARGARPAVRDRTLPAR